MPDDHAQLNFVVNVLHAFRNHDGRALQCCHLWSCPRQEDQGEWDVEGEWDEEDEWEGASPEHRTGTGTAASGTGAPATASSNAPVLFSFDSSKFAMSSLAASLPEPEGIPSPTTKETKEASSES